MKKDELIREIEKLQQHIVKLEESYAEKDRLAQKTSLLASIVKSSNDTIVGLTVSGTIVGWSKGAEKVFGYTPKEVLGSNISILFPADGLEEFMEIHRTALSGQHVNDYETIHLKKNGASFPAILSVSSILSGAQSVAGVSVIVRDITEQKRAEEVLRESEEKYRSLFDHSQDATLLTIPDGSILDANKAACEMFDMPLEKIKNIGRSGLVDETDPRLHSALEERDRTGMGRAEITMIRANGERFPVEVTSAIFTDTCGRQRTSMIIRDITERKNAEAALKVSTDKLKQSEEKYRSIFENVLEGIFQTRPEGNFISINSSMARIHGFESPEEMIASITGIGEQLYVNPESRKNYVKALQEQGVVRDFEAQVYRKDRSIIWTSVNARAIKDTAGNLLYFEGTAEDITERKKFEEELNISARRLRKSLAGTIQVISMMLETRDPYTAGHQKRVSSLARSMAQEMNLPSDVIDIVRMAGSIHDIGKMSVPADILSKPAKLSNVEMELIKIHPRTGYDILRVADLPHLVAEIVLQHHERLDGSGYPRRLKDGEILQEAHILSVADVVEAMGNHRPYRPAIALETALAEIEKNKGILFHPEVVEVCLMLFREKGFRFQ